MTDSERFHCIPVSISALLGRRARSCIDVPDRAVGGEQADDGAADYGLHNLPSEPWHWSTDGS